MLFVSALKKFFWDRFPGNGEEIFRHARQIAFILQRERSRAYRSKDPLSVITFEPRGQEEETVKFLAKVCRERLRVTDEVGWLDSRRLCAILPGTGTEGAWKVADDICYRFPENISPPLCTVLSLPADGDGLERRGTGRQSNGNGHSLHAPVDAGPSRPAIPLPSPNENTRELDRSLPLENLFVRPMPVWKRILDVTGALLALTAFLPVLAIVGLAIKLSSRGPIFFRQWRSGRGGKRFLMFKFRTMVWDAEEKKAALRTLNKRDGPAFKVEKDPRVTLVGRFLRASSIDELPQLWNVLRGEMSLVGPRPLPCEETAASAHWQRQRLDVTPGLTCIWQVAPRSRVAFADWIRMDMKYIRSMSLLQDLKLLVLTVPAIIFRGGDD